MIRPRCNRPASKPPKSSWKRPVSGRCACGPSHPEIDGVLELVAHLADKGVLLALGHTGASGQQIEAAAEAGARLSTHLGNALPPLLPKRSNVLVQQLACDRLAASFIADGHHLPQPFLKMCLRSKGSARTVLITDAASPAGPHAVPGNYRFGSFELVRSENGLVHKPGSGSCAGSLGQHGRCRRPCQQALRLHPCRHRHDRPRQSPCNCSGTGPIRPRKAHRRTSPNGTRMKTESGRWWPAISADCRQPFTEPMGRADAPAATVFGNDRKLKSPPLKTPRGLRLNERMKMDGRKFLSRLPDAGFPVAFFDPQYRGVLDRLGYGNEGQGRGRGRCELQQMPPETIRGFVTELDRVLMQSGHLFLWMDKFHLCSGFSDWLADTSLEVVDMLTWEKGRLGMGYRSRRISEHLVVLQKRPTRAKGVWKVHTIPDVWREAVPPQRARAQKADESAGRTYRRGIQRRRHDHRSGRRQLFGAGGVQDAKKELSRLRPERLRTKARLLLLSPDQTIGAIVAADRDSMIIKAFRTTRSALPNDAADSGMKRNFQPKAGNASRTILVVRTWGVSHARLLTYTANLG